MSGRLSTCKPLAQCWLRLTWYKMKMLMDAWNMKDNLNLSLDLLLWPISMSPVKPRAVFAVLWVRYYRCIITSFKCWLINTKLNVTVSSLIWSPAAKSVPHQSSVSSSRLWRTHLHCSPLTKQQPHVIKTEPTLHLQSSSSPCSALGLQRMTCLTVDVIDRKDTAVVLEVGYGDLWLFAT